MLAGIKFTWCNTGANVYYVMYAVILGSPCKQLLVFESHALRTLRALPSC